MSLSPLGLRQRLWWVSVISTHMAPLPFLLETKTGGKELPLLSYMT